MAEIEDSERAGRLKESDTIHKEIPLDEPLIETGTRAKQGGSSRYYFTTKELLIITIMGIIGGFISGLIPFSLLIETWYPFVGGTQLVSAHHILWSAISYGATRKKSSMVITAIIKGFIMFLLGSQWGVLEILLDIFESLSLVAGFVLIEKFHEGTTNFGWGMACGIGNLTQVPLFWFLTGKFLVINNAFFIMAVMFAFVSGVFIAGLLGKAIVDRLHKADIF
ncbi:MAG TPA: hypothetical protein VKM55_23710 [Candidatus Lokiarchaeia archaeon]|nr:hypothetical protein [Candidatus Lokiarchaeia archaeon]